MSTFIWIVFFSFVVLSFIPVIRLEQVRSHPKYRVLWFLSLTVFAWSVTTTLKMVATESYFIYYFSMLTYPLVYLISFALYETFQTYMGKTTPKIFKITALLFFIIDLIVSLTNPLHYLITPVQLSGVITLDSFKNVEPGIFFYIHTAVCYLLLLIGFIKMLTHLNKNRSKERDVFPFGMVSLSVLFGVSLNIIHIFIYQFNLDPTYLFIVLITFILYTIIYKRDFNINLISSSRQYLFNHMREMYIISDVDGNIIEISKNFKERFNLSENEYQKMDLLIKKLEEKAILYEQREMVLTSGFNKNKTYLNTSNKEFKIGRFKKTGMLTLLYDETDDTKHIFEIEELRSHDMMTGLFNRNYLEENRNLFETKYPKMGSIILDVDGLKIFNDTLGHKVGDRLIIHFSKIILSVNEKGKDMIPIRLGGGIQLKDLIR